MVISNLRKSIFYLQQAIRNDHENDIELHKALDILVKKELNLNEDCCQDNINNHQNYNTDEL